MSIIIVQSSIKKNDKKTNKTYSVEGSFFKI